MQLSADTSTTVIPTKAGICHAADPRLCGSDDSDIGMSFNASLHQLLWCICALLLEFVEFRSIQVRSCLVYTGGFFQAVRNTQNSPVHHSSAPGTRLRTDGLLRSAASRPHGGQRVLPDLKDNASQPPFRRCHSRSIFQSQNEPEKSSLFQYELACRFQHSPHDEDMKINMNTNFIKTLSDVQRLLYCYHK